MINVLDLCEELNRSQKSVRGTASFIVAATRTKQGLQWGPFYTQLKLVKFEVSGITGSSSCASRPGR